MPGGSQGNAADRVREVQTFAERRYSELATHGKRNAVESVRPRLPLLSRDDLSLPVTRRTDQRAIFRPMPPADIDHLDNAP